MENVKELISDIQKGLTKTTASQKDERDVMRAMLNDDTYKVGIYTKAGRVGEYCPYEESRAMFSSIISSTTKLPAAEAEALAKDYQVTNKDADVFVGISKEFVNTYVTTGRKLPLGGRENMSVTLEKKDVAERVTRIPNQDKTTIIPAHRTIKAKGSCPSWLKNK